MGWYIMGNSNSKTREVSEEMHIARIDWKILYKSLWKWKGFNIYKWDKVFKNGPREICGRQPLKNVKWYGLPKADHNPSNLLRVPSTNFTWFIPKYFIANDHDAVLETAFCYCWQLDFIFSVLLEGSILTGKNENYSRCPIVPSWISTSRKSQKLKNCQST